jgi:hypothetical protein
MTGDSVIEEIRQHLASPAIQSAVALDIFNRALVISREYTKPLQTHIQDYCSNDEAHTSKIHALLQHEKVLDTIQIFQTGNSTMKKMLKNQQPFYIINDRVCSPDKLRVWDSQMKFTKLGLMVEHTTIVANLHQSENKKALDLWTLFNASPYFKNYSDDIQQIKNHILSFDQASLPTQQDKAIS